jgi:hypothetical protein
LKDIKSFFDNWKDRNPMLLKINHSSGMKMNQKLVNLIEQYKAKGVIKKYNSLYILKYIYEDFKWI